jgi:hypothetical protein
MCHFIRMHHHPDLIQFENVIGGKLWIRFSISFLSQFQPFPLRAEKLAIMQGTKGGIKK